MAATRYYEQSRLLPGHENRYTSFIQLQGVAPMSQITVVDSGRNNTVSLPEGFEIIKNSQIRIEGDNNEITIGEHCQFDGLTIRIEGNGNKLSIGNSVVATGMLSLIGKGTIIVGDYTTIGRCTMTAFKGAITIGRDCMFANGIEIRTTDSHPVFDLVTRERINEERDVVIEDYVWCGMRVTLMKGSKISQSSVVALGSIVTKQFSKPFCLIGGYPAKVLRNNVTWTRRTNREVLEDDPIAMMYTQDWNDADADPSQENIYDLIRRA
ncbi:acyltransferase [Sinorhizobium meliloti]|uniref:acyltransferase n=1 Tax=Rhizobium meliloti TaxID=382 RepID=UPI00299E6E7D|nr:acyltransferase [Sinorhizobium meliloti]MDX0205754.1 acyltransferase [Sinorhizobium meliloti]